VVRSADEAAVRAVSWSDHVVADLGAWDGAQFTSEAAVPETDLRVRVKPNEQRVVDGGIPMIPRLPSGASVWRYLSMEPQEAPMPAGRPAWTIEGRLMPPPDQEAPPPGRFDEHTPPPASNFDAAIFAYNPAARVWLEWQPRRPGVVLVRLERREPSELIEPAVLDRVWQGIEQVRPAAIRAMLAVEHEIVRGAEDAATE
jgi:hypothetical protein